MRTRLTLVVSAVVVLSLAQVGAAPLDAESCVKLKGEQALLEQGGVRGNMAKGPQWAKANLAADKLGQIRRLIEVEEQLLFRCRGRTLVELPPEPEAEPAAAPSDASEDGKEAPAGADKKAVPKADGAKPKPAAAAKTAAPGKEAKPAQSAKDDTAQPAPDKASTVKPKPKPKPKADDAHKASPPDPKVNPFTTQTSPAKN